jgi:microcystin-dependent protein
MAAFTYTAPTVGGSSDTWGTTLNTNWSNLSTFLGSLDSAELATLDGVDTSGTGFGFVPQGGIIMWSGSVASIPSGWHLCNGSNSTPDLRDRFVVGAGSTYAPDDTGGADSVTLTEAQMPSHTHSFSGTTSTKSLTGNINFGGNGIPSNSGNGIVSATNPGGAQQAGFGSGGVNENLLIDASHNHTVSGTTGSTGSGSSHENRPPYYALAYIMKA